MLGYHGLSEYDTTGAQPGADWRVYLAFHPVARQIIGDDVYRFEVGSLGAWDANVEQRCVDFVVRRVDGTDVRLHHGSVKGVHLRPVGGLVVRCKGRPFASSPCRVAGLDSP